MSKALGDDIATAVAQTYGADMAAEISLMAIYGLLVKKGIITNAEYDAEYVRTYKHYIKEGIINDVIRRNDEQSR